jgi:hypothetical protein
MNSVPASARLVRVVISLAAMLTIVAVAPACDISFGPQPRDSNPIPTITYVLVLPHSRVVMSAAEPAGFPVRLSPGDSLFLILAFGAFPLEAPRDTVAGPEWALTDPSVGSIEAQTAHKSVFVASAEGVSQIRANGQAFTTFSCTGGSCATVARIEVVP